MSRGLAGAPAPVKASFRTCSRCVPRATLSHIAPPSHRSDVPIASSSAGYASASPSAAASTRTTACPVWSSSLTSL